MSSRKMQTVAERLSTVMKDTAKPYMEVPMDCDILFVVGIDEMT